MCILDHSQKAVTVEIPKIKCSNAKGLQVNLPLVRTNLVRQKMSKWLLQVWTENFYFQMKMKVDLCEIKWWGQRLLFNSSLSRSCVNFWHSKPWVSLAHFPINHFQFVEQENCTQAHGHVRYSLYPAFRGRQVHKYFYFFKCLIRSWRRKYSQINVWENILKPLEAV